MPNGITYQPDYTTNDRGYFGKVQIVIGTRMTGSQVIRLCRKTKEDALQDASRRVREIVAFGVNHPIDLSNYN